MCRTEISLDLLLARLRLREASLRKLVAPGCLLSFARGCFGCLGRPFRCSWRHACNSATIHQYPPTHITIIHHPSAIINQRTSTGHRRRKNLPYRNIMYHHSLQIKRTQRIAESTLYTSSHSILTYESPICNAIPMYQNVSNCEFMPSPSCFANG